MLLDCHVIVKRFISKAEGIVKTRGKGTRSQLQNENVETPSQKASEKIRKDEGAVTTRASVIASTKTEEEKQELVEIYKNSDTSLTPEEVNRLADFHLQNLVDIVESEWR